MLPRSRKAPYWGQQFNCRCRDNIHHCQQQGKPLASPSPSFLRQQSPHAMSAQPMSTEASKEKLVADLKLVVSDAEELLRATASQAGEKASAARERIQASLASAKVKLNEAERAALEKAKETAKATDE